MGINNNLNSVNSLDVFKSPEGSKVLYKTIGISQYKYGVRIDKEFHEIFNPINSQFYVSRGQTREIKVLFNNKIHDALYYHEGQKDESVQLQRKSFRKELQEEFKKVFPYESGSFTIQQGYDINHFVFNVVDNDIDDFDEDNGIETQEGRQIIKQHKARERNP